MKPITMKGDVTIEVPRCPNYIKVNDAYLPIAEMKDSQLKRVAVEWRRNLFALAESRRAAKVRTK